MEMEDNFYKEDELSSFLNEATSDFKMYPSRRIWYSLYNDLHPSRKWPSVAVCLLLISAILYLGVVNNNSINKNINSAAKVSTADQNKSIAENNSTSASIKEPSDNTEASKLLASSAVPDNTVLYNQQSSGPAIEKDIQSNDISSVAKTRRETYSEINTGSELVATDSKSSSISVGKNEQAGTDIIAVPNTEISLASPNVDLGFIESQVNNNSTEVLSDNLEENSIPASPNTLEEENKKTEKIDLVVANNKSDRDKEWIDNFAFYNKPKKNSFNSKASVKYYITAAEGFRTLTEKQVDILPTTARIQGPISNIAAADPLNINDKITQKSSIGIEVGATLQYELSERWVAKAGLQYNYTNYISYATYLGHSVITNMTVVSADGNDYYQEKASIYLNSPNSRNDNVLNNTTNQLSVPIGLDYKIAGSNKLKWYAGATVQPGIIFGGNTYALSSDKQYYISDQSLFRKGNVNVGAETFLSYRTGNGISLTAGPQVRYQLFSTYKSSYNYSEKLYNFGLKVGLVKHF